MDMNIRKITFLFSFIFSETNTECFHLVNFVVFSLRIGSWEDRHCFCPSFETQLTFFEKSD